MGINLLLFCRTAGILSVWQKFILPLLTEHELNLGDRLIFQFYAQNGVQRLSLIITAFTASEFTTS